jgi:signal transduction histidine kinase
MPRKTPALDDPTLVELATHDFVSTMQSLYSNLDCADLWLGPKECATPRQAVRDAAGKLESLVKRYRKGLVDHAAFGRRLPNLTARVAAATAALVEQMPGKSSPETRCTQLANAAKIIKAAGVASANLVHGLGKWRSEPAQPLDIGSLLEALADMHLVRANGKGVELLVQLNHASAAPCVPEWMVTTVVGNLLSNAIKYTDRGRIVLSSASHGERGAEVCVTDTGIGMDAETLSTLTHPGTRAHQVVAEGREGQGLGLTLADWAARAVGAKLTFSSELGAGTRASLLIPA